MSLRPDISSLKDMAREALRMSQGSLFGSSTVSMGASAVTETVEHTLSHGVAGIFAASLPFIKGAGKAMFKGATTTAAFGAGLGYGTAKGGYNAVKGAFGAASHYHSKNPLFNFDPEHGLSTGIGAKKLVGLGALGAFGLGLTQTEGVRQQSYRRDADDPTLHRDGLGASGAMVTQSRRSRY